MPITSTTAEPFTIHFAAAAPASGAAVGLRLGLPVLGQTGVEDLLPVGEPAGTAGAFSLYRSGEWLLGCATLPVGRAGLEPVTRFLYDDLLVATRGLHLCRIWNYVPHINALAAGEENYRAFCRGRARAFESEYGFGQFARLCAASAVGTHDDRISVVFVATQAEPRHHENPAQLAAYRYPAEHGPHAPSFARATVTSDRRWVFVSGTAAIKGHATVAPGDAAAQVDCTLDNLALISRVAGLGSDLGAGGGWTRHFKVYLRHAADYAVVSARLRATLLQPGDGTIWLQADICRAALDVEIEATLLAV